MGGITNNNFSRSMSRKYAQDYISKVLVHKTQGEFTPIIKQEVRNMYNLHGQDRLLEDVVRNLTFDPRIITERFVNDFGKEEYGYVHVKVKPEYQNKDDVNYY